MDDAAPPLTVAITSRALFDLEHSHALYEREGVAVLEVEQGARGDRDGQRRRGVVHLTPRTVR